MKKRSPKKDKKPSILESLSADPSLKMEEEDLVKYVNEAWMEAEDHIRGTIKKNWDVSWALYNNEFDFSDKANWQSKNVFPKFKSTIRVANSILKDALFSRDFFSVEGLNDEAATVQNDIKTTLDRVLKQSDFEERFEDGLLAGLLEHLMVNKIFPVAISDKDRPIHEDQRFKFIFAPQSMYRFRIDPRGRGLYVIHETIMDMAEYRQFCERKVYDAKTLDKIEGDFSKDDERFKEARRMGAQNPPKPRWRKEVYLREFWGHVDDDRGRRIYENVTYTIVNEKYLARKPKENPFAHKKPPFIWGPIIKKPFSVYHEGFGDGFSGLCRILTERLNITLDSALYASIKAFEVNLDYLFDPEGMKNGIYPAKVIKTSGVPPGSFAVREIPLGNADTSSLQIMQYIDTQIQNASGVTEFISSMTGSGGEKTATEIKTKGAAGMSAMKQVGRSIERRILEPSIEMLYDLILEWNPEIFGEKVFKLNREALKFKFKVHGITDALSREQELQNLMMWIKIMGGAPQLAPRINWNEVGNVATELLRLNPKSILLPEAGQSRNIGGQPGADEEAGQAADQNAQTTAVQMLPQMMKAMKGAGGGR